MARVGGHGTCTPVRGQVRCASGGSQGVDRRPRLLSAAEAVQGARRLLFCLLQEAVMRVG